MPLARIDVAWVAQQAGVALQYREMPTGSFSYQDDGVFTADQAINRINLFLIPQGYSLERSGNLLAVINLSDARSLAQLDALAELVDPAQLTSSDPSHVVKCLFKLSELDAGDAVDELSALQLMTTPKVLSKTNQLMITDTVDDDLNEDDRLTRGRSSSRLSYSLFSRFDKNRDGRLDRDESDKLGMPVGEIDTDRDGEISRDELSRHVDALQEAAGGYEQGIPGWFYERDLDRDSQVSLAEFAPEPNAELIAEFDSLDTNADGLLTAVELVSSQAVMGGVFRSTSAVTLPPGRTTISEIEISENFFIADLNVQLSITHSHASHLDAYLEGRDGEPIELFTSVGGNDDNFNQTTFNDQASTPITKARAPFEGEFVPAGVLKRQPGLSSFNGKSIQGVWQLIIRGTRNDRFGILHGWSLQAQPLER